VILQIHHARAVRSHTTTCAQLAGVCALSSSPCLFLIAADVLLLSTPLALKLFAVQINAPFGAGIVSASTGILYGNTMDDFAQPNK
jgi:hypothetical protein